MSRNNDERTGALPSAEPPLAAADPSPQQNNSIGLNFVVPTEHVELPSRGQFYPEGHPLRGEQTIEIKHMTAKEEDILTSRTLLKKGLAVDRLLQSVIINKTIKADDLFVGDKNAVIVAARQSAYGDEYKTKVGCQVCGEASDFVFNLSTHVHTHPEDAEDPEFDCTSSGTFIIRPP